MKKIYFLFLLVSVISMQGIDAQSWTALSSGTTQGLYGIFPTTDNIAISVGDNQTLVKTINQGTSWSQQLVGTDIDMRCLYFTSQNVGFTGGSDGTVNTHYIYKTIDGSLSWSLVKTGSPAAIYGINFLNANIGYAVRGNTTSSVIFKTQDGGVSWSTLSNSSTSAWMSNVIAVDNNTAICIGHGGKIQRTTDGGTTWNNSTIGTNDLTGISFPSSTIGYICGFGGKLLKTTDGGTNWNVLTIGSTVNFYSLAFLDVSRGFVVGANGAIFYTADGGLSWSNQSGCTTNALINVKFYNQNLGYACGANGTIVKYTNTIGVEEIENNFNLTVFPNPTNGLLTVNFYSGKNENVNLAIFDILGKELFSEKDIYSSGSFTKQLDISQYKSGVYFVKLQNKNGRIVKKIVIEK
jgi:photosystem II stability/assembly factor-like uncharacterized protein